MSDSSSSHPPDEPDGGGRSAGDEGSEEGWPCVHSPIVRPFLSEETGEPFDSCVQCGGSLVDDDAAYLIQKCSNGREFVFEFALCLFCAAELHASYSEASRRAMLEFFDSRVDPERRAADLFARAGLLEPNGGGLSADARPDVAIWMRECMTCASEPEAGKGYAIAALCAGDAIVVAHAPYLICESCELALNELISPETRGEWDRFIGRNFDLPPTLETLPTRGRLIVV